MASCRLNNGVAELVRVRCSGLSQPARSLTTSATADREVRHGTFRRPNRSAFTLIELLLALSLSALVMIAIGMAMDLHLRALDVRRADVEESQLARAILRRIADDIRGTIVHQDVDFSAAEELVDEQADAAMEDLDDLGLGDLSADLGLEEGEEEETDIESTVTPPPMPGIYGNAFQLQIDVSRLPRFDQLISPIDPADPTAIAQTPSDVKTVAYYMQTFDPALAMLGDPLVTSQGAPGLPSDTTSGGLVRREMDRMLTSWAAETGNLDLLNVTGNVLAPEVTGIQFMYFDGIGWLTEWDTEEMEGVPIAIEIVLSIRPARKQKQTLLNAPLLDTEASAADLFYRMVVKVPLVEPIATQNNEELGALGL